MEDSSLALSCYRLPGHAALDWLAHGPRPSRRRVGWRERAGGVVVNPLPHKVPCIRVPAGSETIQMQLGLLYIRVRASGQEIAASNKVTKTKTNEIIDALFVPREIYLYKNRRRRWRTAEART